MRHLATLVVGQIVLLISMGDGELTALVRDDSGLTPYRKPLSMYCSDNQAIVMAIGLVTDLGYVTRDEGMAAALAMDAINKARSTRSAA